jgi:hypothetical protein
VVDEVVPEKVLGKDLGVAQHNAPIPERQRRLVRKIV